MKFKRLMSLVLAVLLFVCMCTGCNKDEQKNSDGKLQWQTGAITLSGDVFKAPAIERSGEKAPIIAESSKQVDPGRTFTVTGCGFSADNTKAYLYAQTQKSNGKTYEVTPTIVDDTTLMVTVDSKIPYGIYAIYVKNDLGTSNTEYINRPKIWWNGLTVVAAGDEFSVYGENLTAQNGNKSTVYLLDEDDRYVKIEPTYADPFKVSFKIPDILEDGKEYTIKVHNGHGESLGVCEAPEKIKYQKSGGAQFNGRIVNVLDFGADSTDKNNDDTGAFIDAATSLQDGDTLYIPQGTYNINKPVYISSSVKIKGDGASKTNIILNEDFPEKQALFDCSFGPTEFCNIAFKDIRKGKITNYFIKMNEGSGTAGDIYNLYVHDCYFVQNTTPKARSRTDSIHVLSTSGVIIKNNTFEATGMLWTNKSNKIFINQNKYYGTCYVGSYYSQNVGILWNTNGFDASNNEFSGRDVLTDKSGRLEKDDYTTGRVFAIQQEARNLYIANNKIERTGLPFDNAGEQIMLENVYNRYLGSISAADENSITLSDSSKSILKNYIVTVVKGKGVTQWRYVSGANGKKITVDEPWDIIPDSESTVLITGCFDNIAIYNNSFDCFKNFAETSHTATTGVEVYGNTHNLFIKGNSMKNMNYGFRIVSHYKYLDDEENGVFWSYFDDNKIEDVCCGIDYKLAKISTDGSGEIPMYSSFGLLIRNNSIKNTVDYEYDNRKGLGGIGIEIGTPRVTYHGWPDTTTWAGFWEYGAVIENNTFENCSLKNIYMCKHQGGMVLINNKVLGGPNKELYTIEEGGAEPFYCK